MTATAHAIVGASIALKIQNPVLALPLAFVSHFIFDKLPHWDPMTNHATKSKKAILVQTIADVIIGYILVTIMIYFAGINPVNNPCGSGNLLGICYEYNPLFFYIYLASFVSQLPDWLEIPYMFHLPDFLKAEWNYKLQSWVHDVGFNSRMQAPWGVVTQVVVSLVFIIWGLS